MVLGEERLVCDVIDLAIDKEYCRGWLPTETIFSRENGVVKRTIARVRAASECTGLTVSLALMKSMSDT